MKQLSAEDKKWLRRCEAELLAQPYGGMEAALGRAVFRGKLINSYLDDSFLYSTISSHIAPALPYGECLLGDFGSGTGIRGFKVADQLQRPDHCIVRPIGVDIFNKELWTESKPKFFIPVVQGDLKDLPIKSNTFHAGLFRHALAFVPKDDQPKVFEEIYQVLKPGAVLVVLNFGAFNKTEAGVAWNALFAKTAECEGLYNMHYPTCDDVMAMAKKAGFLVKHAFDLTDEAFSLFSPQVAALVIDKELDWPTKRKMRRELKALFQERKQDGVMAFEPSALRPKSLRTALMMYSCVLEK
ncbi:MAG: class I SAM-dependent methyltransferase [Bdellovibrionales bacterium]